MFFSRSRKVFFLKYPILPQFPLLCAIAQAFAMSHSAAKRTQMVNKQMYDLDK